MRYFVGSIALMMLSIVGVQAQMINGTDTLYGNEWINHSQTYLKIEIAADGIHRIDYNTMNQAGIPLTSIQGSNLQLFHFGEEIPLYITTNGTFSTADYIEFFGEKNRSRLDSFIYLNGNNPLNPYYSLFTDTAAYYLTWNANATGLRYQNVNNNLANAPAKEDYFMYDYVQEYHNAFTKKRASGYIYDSRFQVEGFSHSVSSNRSLTYTINHIYTSGPVNATATVQLAVVEDGTHHQTISLEGTTYIDENFNGYVQKRYDFAVPISSLTNPVELITANDFDNKDKSAIAYFKLKYPRAFDFDNQDFFEFYIEASNTDKYLEIDNFNTNATSLNPILLDITNQIYIQTTYDANDSKVKVVLPPSNEKRRLILYNPNTAALPVSHVQTTNFIDFNSLNSDYVIISNSKLFNDPSSNTNWVQEYADYRSSALGGGYNAVVIEIDDLYEQFAYGVQRTPLSIRNFAHFMKRHWTNGKYIFMIGKGIEYRDLRSASALSTHSDRFLIPTFGFVGADNLLAASPNGSIPLYSIGRLAATDPFHVKTYLDKVKVYEANKSLPQTQADKGWMKRILHLGGGDPSIQASIKNSLINLGNNLAQSKYGAEVIGVYKTSGDPIQISTSERITQTINDGVSIMTFFGHSYAGGFDVSIDEPGFYQNTGKYPLILSYGCYSGRIHSTATGISESFVLEPDKGAIAFMSSNGLATVPGLTTFGAAFYDKLGNELYGAGIGDVLRAANQATEFNTGEIVRQMTLHGDPAIRLNTHEGPDYLVDASSVTTLPKTIDIQEDSFQLNFNVINIGSHFRDSSIVVKVTQELPNGELLIVKSDTIASPASSTSLNYQLSTIGDVAIGLNKFYIEVDAGNQVTELPAPDAEMNNLLVDNNGALGYSVFFTSNNISPLYPLNFGIVSDQNVEFKAAPSDLLAASKTYVFELDTTEMFNSPFKIQHKITQAGGILRWQPNVLHQDSTVYYWRVSPDSVSAVGYTWKSSSYIYINAASNGWNQSHYYQQVGNQYYNTRLKANTRKVHFIDDFKDLIIENLVNSNTLDRTELFINNTRIDLFRPSPHSGTDVFIIALDSFNITPIFSNPPGGIYGSTNNHGSRTYTALTFKAATESERLNIINFLDTIVPSSSYVLFMTLQKDANDSYFPEQWAADSVNLGTNLFQILEQQGATQIRQTEQKGSLPYVFLYQKDKAPLTEELADTISEKISIVYPIAGAWDEGYVKSIPIGPATDWQTLQWRASSADNPQADHYSMDVLGVASNGEDTLLASQITNFNADLSFINANDFPFIQLRYNSLDTNFRTSAHLEYWRVLYQGVPDLALVPNKYFQFYNDTLEQGELVSFEIAVENISSYPTDSVQVKYTLTDVNNNKTIKQGQLGATNSGDTLHTAIQFETESLRGLNALTLEVNHNQDQLEQYFTNNTAIKSFYVRQDKRHPTLDVTFDGAYIMDGDIVSTEPQVLLKLRDDNPFLALNDTSAFKIWIIDPEGNQRRYYNDGQTMIFYPADESNLMDENSARIEFKPVFNVDGIYQLIVQAQDRTGNSSGNIDYKVSFEVVTESMISHVLNYPNPFTTSTQFVFTLTGNRVPDDLRIQIYTVSGRLVREITKEELGNLRMGLNRTDFRWDGTDQFGDRLANGVYLYRVIATMDGEEMDNYYTPAIQYIKNGFGKMVLMR